MDVCALDVLLTLDPALDVDVAHLLPGEEGVVLQHHVVRVPDDAAQLVALGLPRGDVHLRPRRRHVHREHVHPHLDLTLQQRSLQ